MELHTQHDSTATSHTLFVFVHGNGLCQSIFNSTIAGLLALNEGNPERGIHCLSVDLPGHGKSSTAGQILEEFTVVSHFARGVENVVNEFVANSKVKYASKVLVAHSVGAQVSLFANKTLKFDHAVLVEPGIAPKLNGGRQTPPQAMLDKAKARRRIFPSYQAAFDALRPKGIFAQWEEESVRNYVFNGGFRLVNGDDNSSEEVELSCNPELEARIFGIDVTEYFPELEHTKFKSCTVMVGSNSVLIPHKAFEMISEALKAKHVVVDNAWHCIMCERPLEVSQEIYQMLEFATAIQQRKPVVDQKCCVIT